MLKTTQFIFLLVASLGLPGCEKDVRVPLPTPLPTVGGARPAVDQGVQFLMEFGDGVWGQEQERAEMFGAGLGGSVGGRFEGLYSTFHSTREVRVDSTGVVKSGPWAHLLRGKLRIVEFADSRGTLGVHVARTWVGRNVGADQNEKLTALDFAVPVEFRLHHRAAEPGGLPVRELSSYAGPRAVIQTIREPATGESDRGTLVAILFGMRGRWNALSVIGEVNLSWTPGMELGGIRSEPGFIVLPMLGVRASVPIGETR